VRDLARQTGFSKSSVHRLEQALTRRDCHPESWWWETEDGRRWITRLVVATLYPFGLKRGVGAETLSEFLVRLRLERHVGCSPSALRGVMEVLAQAILETTQTWEREGSATGEPRSIIAAVDETFLERMMLVFMDLGSGYVLFEEVAPDRTYDTWYSRVKARLDVLGTEVLYVVSDRAQALIKLAETGLQCLSIPDVFHLSHDVVKSYSLAIASRLSHARQALGHAQEHLALVQASAPGAVDVLGAQALLEAREAEVRRWEDMHGTYRHHLAMVSFIVHPWRLVDSTPQTSHEVERQLHAEITAIET
jgi:hypothetical protein